ncbi:Cuticle protein 14 isoform b [Frankliniella fusca]|uniref:Cuticle protein 14 isoform b n=1 Tax=Frankliniella fusca TaxID=407009 RepID=A0AAE1LKC4_9NEOP|nr:Cuticle protein 14 isoform b [Frankliniella fusca]
MSPLVGRLLPLLAVTSCGAQIFPFSNLRHIFDQKDRGGGGGGGVSRASTPPPQPTLEASAGAGRPGTTTTLEPPTTTTGLAPYLAPYSLYDEDSGYREPQQRPEYVVERPRPATRPGGSRAGHKGAAAAAAPVPAKQPQAAPTRTAARAPPRPASKQHDKHAKRLLENHSRPSHLVPVRIAYEPTTPSSGDVHVPPSGDGPGPPLQPMRPPPLYLTPPRLPDANPSATADAEYPDASASPTSLHVVPALTTEAVDASPSASGGGPAPVPLPPVPAVYLRPPGPPTGPARPVLFKLDLVDVANEALSHSTNPAVLRPTPPPGGVTNSIVNGIANHKLASASAPHNALLPTGQHKGRHKGKEHPTNHKDDIPNKGNHRPEPAGPDTGQQADGDNSLVESSAAESAATAAIVLEDPGHRTPGNHRPGPRPLLPPTQAPARAPKFKNHKPAPPGQAPAPARPVKYHNHRPASLDGEESMTSLRYRKRPLGPIEQVHYSDATCLLHLQEVAQTGLQHQGEYPHAGDGERVEFQMHGLKGPSSYKFGYDTGKGQNRQFRYEERDHHGNVKGHYGYVDEHGKLQVVNYKADPHGGYKADVSKLHT